MSSFTLPARGGGRPTTIHIDTVMLLLVSSIVLLGLIVVASASMSIGTKESGDPFIYLERQFVLVMVGSFAASCALAVRTEWLERFAPLLLAGALLLLVAVLVPGVGHVVNGSRRWIRLAGFNFQASEAARVMVLVFIASYAVRREAELRSSFKGLARPLGVVGVFFGLLLLEPDFGAATVLAATAFGVLFIAGARLRDVLALAVVGAGLLATLAVSSPYRLRRLTSFLDPWQDPFNSGFQLTQSLIAIGRGGWTGVGLGESVQKLFYLPEAHTDFLFAVLSEELGLLGILLTIGLFVALALRALWVARLASEAGLKFPAYLAAGFGLWVAMQAFINMGVNMGLLPTKGLTLPFMSYGRSSMIVTLAWVGMVLRVYHEAVQASRGTAAASLRGSHAARTRDGGSVEALQA
ncbi:MAG: putative lipid II flippase FtsW [Gammaproteobacteria bacterium]|jgi:cell division protein FtsW|nr:putative lipid II flippase FtsW [Gammaproteobacteria bacterium]NDB15884.1 putative lipid II flippase FtsW [Gammaproteobacteria bacterium]NDF86379.1 putative lipid II flippase FtsW [Gammaproteobacteria bacterium]